MKKLSILLPAVVAGILVSAMVLAAPQPGALQSDAVGAPDRAVAYKMAMAD